MERQSCLPWRKIEMQHVCQHRKQKTDKQEKTTVPKKAQCNPRNLQEQCPSFLATHHDACIRLRKHELVYEKVYNLMRRWFVSVHEMRSCMILATMPNNFVTSPVLDWRRTSQTSTQCCLQGSLVTHLKEFRYTSADLLHWHSAKKTSVTTG